MPEVANRMTMWSVARLKDEGSEWKVRQLLYEDDLEVILESKERRRMFVDDKINQITTTETTKL